MNVEKHLAQPKVKNSTARFLVFTMQSGGDSLEVRVEGETIWMTQKLMAKLFDCGADNIGLHLKNVFSEAELNQDAVTEEFSVTASDGKTYKTKHYNLDAIISVGYRVNSNKATQFRQWATQILREYAIKGFVLDDERLKNGQYFGRDYFEALLQLIREIRASERRFYQKITDLYSTAYDYDPDDRLTKEFFAVVQNKLHFAIHGQTAAELISSRADSDKPYMGLTNWKYSPNGRVLKTDVGVAKNYLTKKEVEKLDRFTAMFLDYAENMAERQIPLTMADWLEKLDAFLKFNQYDILNNPGKVTAAMAKALAESEFEKYRPVQERIFESDFDRETKRILG